MHKKIEELEKKIVECACAKIAECGIESISTEEMGQVTDMIKDLSEARFHEATTKAMEEAEEYYDDDKAGYDNYRYMRTGRYAPRGRGTYVGRGGYTPEMYTHMMDEPREYPSGYPVSNGTMGGNTAGQRSANGTSGDGGRYGYSMPTDDYGRTYESYRNRKRAYTENATSGNKEMMEKSAKDHLDKVVVNIREMWQDVDQPMKQEMRQSLMNLLNEMA